MTEYQVQYAVKRDSPHHYLAGDRTTGWTPVLSRDNVWPLDKALQVLRDYRMGDAGLRLVAVRAPTFPWQEWDEQ